MSLHFLIDQCVVEPIPDALVRAGYQVTRLREVLPIRAPDLQVIAKAQSLDAILVSLNGDFSDIATYPPTNYGGIIAIQLDNRPEIIPQLMKRLVGFFAVNPKRDFYRKKLLRVKVHSIRIRE